MPADGKTIVEANLVQAVTQGHVVVNAVGTASLRVLVDGVDVGATPWEGDLPPGTHSISGRSSTATAKGETLDIAAGSRHAIDLVSADTAAHLQIRATDGKGDVFVDGVRKGDGSFTGDLPPGPHTVVVSRDGFVRFEKTMTLTERQTWAETVTLKAIAGPETPTGVGVRGYEGIYGGMGLFGAAGIGGMGTELETNCSTLGAASCSTPNPLGAGLFGYVGWTYDPVGFELFAAGMYDEASQKATFNATQSSSSVLPAATPARVETFTFQRAGGLARPAGRGSAFQTLERSRGTIAGGPGISYRDISMKRDAVASDASGRTDTYTGSAAYLSPGPSRSRPRSTSA